MDTKNSELQQYQKSAFSFALYITNNFDIAEEISMQVISLFLLQSNKIENPNGWIINTSKNYCNKYFTKQKREKKIIDSFHKEFNSYIKKNDDDNNEIQNAFQESYKELNDNELSTLLYYFNCDKNIKKMHENTGESYAALRKRISRIKKKIKAETFRKLGYYGSKKIVTPQLNDLIIKFLQRFKHHVENDTLNKMFYYFSEIDLSKFNFKFDIKKILDYDITIVNSLYKTWVVFQDNKGIPNSFHMTFFVDNKNHLKIVLPPKLVNHIKVVKTDSIEGKKVQNLLDKIPVNLSGQHNISKDELEKLLNNLSKKEIPD